jgi:Tfp pilus assembly PilM family ATPase
MRPNKIISIAMSEMSIDFMEVNRKRNSNQLISYGSYTLDLNDLDQFNEIISTIAQTVKKPYYTGISIIHRDVLRTTFIINNTNDLKTSILQFVKKTYEISLSDHYIDFITEDISNNKTLVFFAAIPKKTLDPLFDIFNKHDFKLLFLEIASLSALRHVEEQFDYNFFLYIHFDYHLSSIVIVKDSMIYAIRYVNLGFEDMIDSLSESAGISQEKAESLFFEYGVKEIEPDIENFEIMKNIHNDIISSLDKLSLEIQRTIDYFTITYKQPTTKNFIISGTITKIPEYDKYLSKLFSVNIDVEDNKQVLTVSENITPDFSSMHYPFVCIGAALR